jgi:CheY-like chemotaxis protein
VNISHSIVILIAEDDPDDQLLTREALDENKLTNEIRFVNDGQELIDYLYRRGSFAEPSIAPRPDLILLDLNMPRMDGREALQIIKSDADLRRIPIVVMTTSKAEEDILRTYDLGVNSFIVKPVTFDSLVNLVRVLADYWFSIVRLPTRQPV